MYNIVIVENEPIELESLTRSVSRYVENSMIYEASTGREAIQLIDELSQIDMMFVDINIPLADANQVIKYLKKNNPASRVIVTTANADFDIVHNMLSLKVDDYLLKPVKPSILWESIKKNLLIDEQAATASRVMRQEIADLIDNCDYPRWHDYLLSQINTAYTVRGDDYDNSTSLTDFLDRIQQHLVGLGDKFISSRHMLGDVRHLVNQQGLTENNYWRIMLGLLTLSENVFEQTYKNNSNNMDFIDRSLFHIEKGILKNITLDDISAKAFVSSCYLSRAFKKSLGIGFSSYITNRKIVLAKSMLQFSNMKINTIALELAWLDANYFCRIFKKETHIAPSDYRRIIFPQIS